MTHIQAILLEMAKEIDLICRNNDIEYYLSGGSVIGALRHKGFIPWDDDVDILMTRKSWKKFLKSCETQLPPNRKLECIETNDHFNNTVNRYINTSTLNVHKNELLDETTAGIVVDIILLDSIPNEDKYYKKYLKDILVYSDLICLPYMYLLRWKYKVPYRLYLWLTKKVGRKKVSEFFEKRLDQYSRLKCDKYVVAWGAGPTLFDKTVFGTPRYLEFEDYQFPVPEKTFEFLRILYGYDVMDVPPKKNRVTHDTVMSYDHNYADFISRMEKIGWNKERAIQDAYLPHKRLAVKWAPRQNADSHRSTLIEAYKVKWVLENRIQKENINVSELFEQGKYDTLRDLFREYISKQCSRTYIGGEMWAQLTRRHDPVFIDVSDELLGDILHLLIYDGELEKMERILRAREMTKKEPLGPRAARAKEFLLQMREAINCYDAGEYKGSLSILLSLDQEYPHVVLVSKLKIRIWNYELKTNQKMCDELIQRELERFPEDGELIKYYADLVYRKNGIKQSWQLYKHAFDQTRHGIFRNEIVDILTNEMDWMYKRVTQHQEVNEWEEAQALLNAWSVIPDVLKTDLRYQQAYFNQQMSLCESEQEWQSVRKRVLRLWDNVSDKTVLMGVYQRIMGEIGENTTYLNEKIVLCKKSTYQELESLHKNLVQRAVLEDDKHLRFLKGVTAYRMGCHGEAFEEFRRLWQEEANIAEVGQILSNDLLHQIVRMNRMKSVAARKFFAAEWTMKYPDATETAQILVTLGLCHANRQEEAAEAIDNVMKEMNYDKAAAKLLRILCRPKLLEIEEK